MWFIIRCVDKNSVYSNEYDEGVIMRLRNRGDAYSLVRKWFSLEGGFDFYEKMVELCPEASDHLTSVVFDD